MESKASRLANLLQLCIDKKAHRTGKLIHAYILRNGLLYDTFLSNRLVELYSKCSNMAYAHQTFDEIPRKDVFSWNAILSACCKAGNLQQAHDLFAKMPERNSVSWNNVISALVRNRFEREALDVYDGMVAEGFEPTQFTLASVCSACGVVVDANRGRRCHGLVVKIGLDKNLYVSNALLSMYAKCGVIEDSVRCFQDMAEPNEVAFTALITGLAQNDRIVEAFELFRLMMRKGIRIDSVLLSSVMGVCARGQNDGKQVHCLKVKLGFDGDLHLNNSLLDMYAKSGDMNGAEKAFSNMPQVNVVSWNVMIAGYGQSCWIEKAQECLERMRNTGIEPDEITYINMLAACVKSGDIEVGRQMFNTMANPNVISWNAMLSCYFQSGNHNEAVKLFREMQFRHEPPDRTTLAIVLSSCAGVGYLEAGKQIHCASIKAAFDCDVFVASGLIGLYSKSARMELAKRVFHQTPDTDNVCWNSMMAGFSLNSLDEDAFSFFRQMRRNGTVPSQFSYSTVLSSCAKLSSSRHGKQIHSLTMKDGFASDVFVGSSLIDMHCKCGDVDEARQVFDSMINNRNTVTWNEMIHGYAQNGRGDEAISLYKEMIEQGENPDGVTFVAVLTACSHSGLSDMCMEIFNSMERDHEVEPSLDHYTCVVDCLGRSGRFEEVEVVVDTMPCKYKDDPIIWEVVLSSCRVHGNVSLARRAADELYRLSPHDSTPYVLLGNIYSSLGRWDEARDVRELMNHNQITKNPGYSWVEHRAEDTSIHCR